MFFARKSLTTYLALGALCTPLVGCGSDAPDGQAHASGDDHIAAAQLAASGTASAIQLTADKSFCVDISGDSQQNGAAVALYPCNGTDAQAWTVQNGLIAASNNRCLNVKNGKKDNGAKLQIWSCNSGDINNQFSIQNGQIVWKGNGKCLDLSGGQKTQFGPLQMYSCDTSNTNQGWTLSAAAKASAGSSSSNSGSSTVVSSTQMVSGSPVGNLKKLNWNEFHHVKMNRGAVNHEQEAYIDNGSTISINSDNQLVIRAYVASDNNGAKGKSTKWNSGRLTSRNLNATRGYIEARMKTPSAAGTWPAFWVMPSDNNPSWPQGGEIDIMEQVDGRDEQNVSTHYGNSPSATKNTHLNTGLKNMSNHWHTYGLAFDSSHCAFYVDGKKVQTVKYPGDSPFAKKMPGYGMILNLAMGGDWPKAAESSIGDQYLVTDYVAQSADVPSDF